MSESFRSGSTVSTPRPVTKANRISWLSRIRRYSFSLSTLFPPRKVPSRSVANNILSNEFVLQQSEFDVRRNMIVKYAVYGRYDGHFQTAFLCQPVNAFHCGIPFGYHVHLHMRQLYGVSPANHMPERAVAAEF